MELVGSVFNNIINSLISGVFIVIVTIMNSFVAPVVNSIVALFPNMESAFLYFLDFLEQASTFLTCVYRWFLFTPQMFATLFLYFVAKYGIWAVSSSVRLVLKYYDKLKP